jgi:mannose-1-phosphate guanylyltransferase
MAGGGGTRLWPLSKPDRPKQLLPLLGGRTLFSQSIERLIRFLPVESIFVVAGADLVPALQQDAPGVPADHFLVEPSPRNTAPAIAFALGMLRKRSPLFTMACLPADHFIASPEAFQQAFSAGVSVAERGFLVTLGIEPTGPNTGYGYIEMGERLEDANGCPVHRVRRFKEKPGLEEARAMIAQGGHAWNSGMFFWRSDVLEEELRTQQPAMSAWVETLIGDQTPSAPSPALKTRWLDLPVVSVDYAIMEGAGRTAVVPAAELGWTDIGDWDALLALYAEYPQLRTAESGIVLDTGSRGLAVFRDGIPKRTLATVGLDDVIIVETEDTILVCKRGRAQEVRVLVAEWKKRSPDSG